MQHFANFGYIKQANKQLKRLNEVTSIPVVDGSLGKTAKYLSNNYKTPPSEEIDFINRRKMATRAERKYKASLKEKILQGNPTPDTQGFSDIRKTDDYAASPSGYLGFRTDPYKGYGGMMEEPVPVTRKQIKLKY